MTYSIIIQDNGNKIFQRFGYISGNVEEKITNNVAKLQSLREWLNMHTTTHNVDVKYLIDKGYTESNSLYDGLIMEYNNKEGIKEFLTA